MISNLITELHSINVFELKTKLSILGNKSLLNEFDLFMDRFAMEDYKDENDGKKLIDTIKIYCLEIAYRTNKASFNSLVELQYNIISMMQSTPEENKFKRNTLIRIHGIIYRIANNKHNIEWQAWNKLLNKYRKGII